MKTAFTVKKSLRKVKRIRLTKKQRIKIFVRDNYECQLCKPKKDLRELPDERVIDHKIPLSKGGTNCLANLWLTCKTCDKKKKNKLYDDLVSEYIHGKLEYHKNKMADKSGIFKKLKKQKEHRNNGTTTGTESGTSKTGTKKDNSE